MVKRSESLKYVWIVICIILCRGFAKAVLTETGQLRAAIVSTSEARGFADLLSVKLAAEPGIVLLERDRIHRVLEEKALSASALPPKDAWSIGKELTAQVLVLMDVERLFGGRQRLHVKVMAVQAGFVVNAFAFDWPLPNAEMTAELSRQEIMRNRERCLAAAPLVISMPVFKAAFRVPGVEPIEQALYRLLMERLSKEPDIFVGERQNLLPAIYEQAGEGLRGGNQTRFVMVEGTIENELGDNRAFTLKLYLNRGHATNRIVVAGHVDQLVPTIKKAADQMLEELKRKGARTWDEAGERAYYKARAEWLTKINAFQDAVAAAEAAIYLGEHSEAIEVLRLQAYWKSLIPQNNVQINFNFDSAASLKRGLTVLLPALQAAETYCERHPGHGIRHDPVPINFYSFLLLDNHTDNSSTHVRAIVMAADALLLQHGVLFNEDGPPVEVEGKETRAEIIRAYRAVLALTTSTNQAEAACQRLQRACVHAATPGEIVGMMAASWKDAQSSGLSNRMAAVASAAGSYIDVVAPDYLEGHIAGLHRDISRCAALAATNSMEAAFWTGLKDRERFSKLNHQEVSTSGRKKTIGKVAAVGLPDPVTNEKLLKFVEACNNTAFYGNYDVDRQGWRKASALLWAHREQLFNLPAGPRYWKGPFDYPLFHLMRPVLPEQYAQWKAYEQEDAQRHAAGVGSNTTNRAHINPQAKPLPSTMLRAHSLGPNAGDGYFQGLFEGAVVCKDTLWIAANGDFGMCDKPTLHIDDNRPFLVKFDLPTSQAEYFLSPMYFGEDINTRLSGLLADESSVVALIGRENGYAPPLQGGLAIFDLRTQRWQVSSDLQAYGTPVLLFGKLMLTTFGTFDNFNIKNRSDAIVEMDLSTGRRDILVSGQRNPPVTPLDYAGHVFAFRNYAPNGDICIGARINGGDFIRKTVYNLMTSKWREPNPGELRYFNLSKDAKQPESTDPIIEACGLSKLRPELRGWAFRDNSLVLTTSTNVEYVLPIVVDAAAEAQFGVHIVWQLLTKYGLVLLYGSEKPNPPKSSNVSDIALVPMSEIQALVKSPDLPLYKEAEIAQPQKPSKAQPPPKKKP